MIKITETFSVWDPFDDLSDFEFNFLARFGNANDLNKNNYFFLINFESSKVSCLFCSLLELIN